MPSTPADPRTLIRRISFDLTGLPPNPEEVEAFVKSARRDQPSAVNALIERLLDSPQYGERWGRWWLDVARYADSNGQDENKVMGNAWRYRDWVIRAFNSNKPFDQFITEQLAGDLLPVTSNERENFGRLTATGFLVLGPKMLAEQDKPKLVMDIVDEQIDTVGRAFLGLTLGCARCHDHKFDPVSARDYYAMAGIFKSTRTMENLDFVSKFNERSISTKEELAAISAHAQRMNEITNRIHAAVQAANDALVTGWQRDLLRYLAAASSSPAAASSDDLNTNVLQRLRVLLAFDPATNATTRFLQGVLANPPAFVGIFNSINTSTTTESAKLAEDDSRQVALKDVREVLLGTNGVFALPKDPRPFYPATTREALLALEKERDTLKAAAPPAAYVMAVADDKLVELPVYLRGSHLNPTKDPVPRGFIQVINRSGSLSEIPREHSGRLELARWLTDPENPLTARVIVNRIWQAHFGEGLVRTSDNFGLRGESPSHPELLDWLSSEFIRSGWDVKAMHRLLLSSAVYHSSSNTKSEIRDLKWADPDNRLLSRFPRQRLEAEMIRDAILAISGRLDPEMGGSLVNWKNNEYVPGDEVSEKSLRRTVYLPIVRDRVFDALTIFDFANPSVCSARRTTTVVSHQALFFMNSPIVTDASRALAKRLLARTDLDDAARIREAHARILNRPATRADVRRALRFLADLPHGAASADDELDPKFENLASLCQTIFASNEFVYRY